MSDSVLILDRIDETTAVLTLNRPDKRNALNIELMEALCRAIASLGGDSRCRVVIVRGAGPAFCAGLDLNEAVDTNAVERAAECVAELLRSVSSTSLITIAAAHGAAYAGGAGLMTACDFVVASDDLRICFPEVRRGLVPALVSTILRDRLRDSDLRELLLLAEPIDARRALNLGLANSVVAVDSLFAEASRIAGLIIRGAPDAIRMTKQLLREIRSSAFPDLLRIALDIHTRARNSPEAQEGLAAFRQSRDPIW